MKKFLKFFVLVLMFICAVVLTGCSDNSDDLISLEQSVTDLQTMIEELQSDRDILYDEIQDLLDEIEKLEKDVDSKESIIYALRNEVAESYGKLREVQNEMALLESKIEATRAGIRVMLADEYTLVVGDNFQLFYRSIVQAPDPYGYYIKLTGKKGHAYNRYYEFCPEANEVGTYELKVSVCDANGVEYGSDTTKLVVVANKGNNSPDGHMQILLTTTSTGTLTTGGVVRWAICRGEPCTGNFNNAVNAGIAQGVGTAQVLLNDAALADGHAKKNNGSTDCTVANDLKTMTKTTVAKPTGTGTVYGSFANTEFTGYSVCNGLTRKVGYNNGSAKPNYLIGNGGSTAVTYYVYFWLDGETIGNGHKNQTYSGYIHASASQLQT